MSTNTSLGKTERLGEKAVGAVAEAVVLGGEGGHDLVGAAVLGADGFGRADDPEGPLFAMIARSWSG